MVMKKCKICGKEFDAKGRQVCCSDECKKINRKMNLKKSYDKYYENNKEDRKEYYKKYYENNEEEKKKYNQKYWEKYFQRNDGLVGGDMQKDKHGNIIIKLGSDNDEYSYNAEKEMEKARKLNEEKEKDMWGDMIF